MLTQNIEYVIGTEILGSVSFVVTSIVCWFRIIKVLANAADYVRRYSHVVHTLRPHTTCC